MKPNPLFPLFQGRMKMILNPCVCLRNLPWLSLLLVPHLAASAPLLPKDLETYGLPTPEDLEVDSSIFKQHPALDEPLSLSLDLAGYASSEDIETQASVWEKQNPDESLFEWTPEISRPYFVVPNPHLPKPRWCIRSRF